MYFLPNIWLDKNVLIETFPHGTTGAALACKLCFQGSHLSAME